MKSFVVPIVAVVFGIGSVGTALAQELAASFLAANFTNEERHVRRLNKVRALESSYSGSGRGEKSA